MFLQFIDKNLLKSIYFLFIYKFKNKIIKRVHVKHSYSCRFQFYDKKHLRRIYYINIFLLETLNVFYAGFFWSSFFFLILNKGNDKSSSKRPKIVFYWRTMQRKLFCLFGYFHSKPYSKNLPTIKVTLITMDLRELSWNGLYWMSILENVLSFAHLLYKIFKHPSFSITNLPRLSRQDGVSNFDSIKFICKCNFYEPLRELKIFFW